jgi:hypothetical protein
VSLSRLFLTSCTTFTHPPDTREACARIVSSPHRALAWQFSPPWSDTSGHLGGAKSALTGAYTLSLVAAAGTILYSESHTVPPTD